MKRFGQIIFIRPDKKEDYKNYHARVWPKVLEQITRCNIRNYTVFMKDNVMFGYFEYHGDNFQDDMKIMAEDPHTQKWWSIMGPMQIPLDTREDGEWWANMEEVFHHD